MSRGVRFQWPSFPSRRAKFFAYVYMANLTIPFAYLFLLPPARAMVGAVLIVMFAAVYVWTIYAPARVALTGACIEVLLMLFMITYLNPGYVWMIFYPSACIGLSFHNARQVLRAIGAMDALVILVMAATSSENLFTLGNWGMLFPAFIASAATGLGTMWQSQTQRKHHELRKANLQIERLTKVAERDRISQDLHDVMGHELSMITLKAQLVQRLIERDPERAKAEARDIEQAARKALSRVREYISDIRQPRLEEEWSDAVKLLQAAGMSCTVDMQVQLVNDERAVSQAFAMCLREASTNIARHSQAKNVFLKYWQADGFEHLLIADDGIGLKNVTRDEPGRHGNGLNGIRARMAAVEGFAYFWSDGTPTTKSTPPLPRDVPWRQGTVIELRVLSEDLALEPAVKEESL